MACETSLITVSTEAGHALEAGLFWAMGYLVEGARGSHGRRPHGRSAAPTADQPALIGAHCVGPSTYLLSWALCTSYLTCPI